MKTLVLFLALAFECFAQSPVSLSEPVVGPDGSALNGRATFTISAPCQQAGNYVQAVKTAAFLSGAFSVSLWPNDTCNPSYTYYAVAWVTCSAQSGASTATPCPLGGTHTWFEKWRVTSSAMTIGDVVVPASFSTLAFFPLLNWSSLAAASWFSINPSNWSSLTR